MLIRKLLKRDVLVAVFNAISAIICAACAGCKLAVGELEIEFQPIESNTNVVTNLVRN